MGITSDIKPEKITSDLRFYEINTCEISIIKFLIENPNVIYQDHYKVKFNDYSLMKCFGLITGIDQINDEFYISVGTNTFLNLVYLTLIWGFLISLFKKSNEYFFNLKFLLSLLSSALLLTWTVYIEERFYVKNVYFFDFESMQYFIQLFILILFICIVSSYFLTTRLKTFIIFLPFLYLLIGVISGTNFNFFITGFVVLGIYRFLKNDKFWISKYYYFFLLFLWTNNAYFKNFYVDPDKIRGFTSSLFSGSSVLAYGLLLGFIINGSLYIFEHIEKFDVATYLKNILSCSVLILFLGYLGSSMPVVNFLNYYYFGLNKYGINRSNLFGVNEWGERLAWRGQFPSAETIGEFFGLGLLLYLILYLKNQIIFKKIDLLLIGISFIGLFVSNNRAALLSIFICLFIFLYKEKVKLKSINYVMVGIIFVTFVILVGLNNFSYSIDFLKDSLVNQGVFYSSGETLSSSLNYLVEARDSNKIIYGLIGFISIVGFFVNRSELWGIFISRYDPEFQELIFGSGVNNFGQLYGEIYINPTYSFLLPHSSILSYLLFVGILNLSIVLIYLITNIYTRLKNGPDIFVYLAIYVFLNLLKSDSLLYFSSFMNYLFIFYFAIKKDKRLV
ncbi:MAG: hypothetical protein CMD34_05835 [Flavobacteriales bacterium]|nr:hypothetical protein [Flavobacteriales bacterium]